MSIAYLSLGGNLGDRRRYLADAVAALSATTGVSVLTVSSVYETDPVGVVDQPKFLNIAVGLETTLPPKELLHCCFAIEAEMGRVRVHRWGPRTIDLDVLWFDGLTIAEPELQVPHPRMQERAFVLVPLAEIAPTVLLNGVPVSELAQTIDKAGLRRLGPLASTSA